MGSPPRWVIPLERLTPGDEALVGGKASRLGLLSQKGFVVPNGFCLPVSAYELFVRENDLDRIVRLELDRKSLLEMRWEEIWDAALRIRSAFNAAPIPPVLERDIRSALAPWPSTTKFAVRSSAPGEDSLHFSFAGLHESRINVCGVSEIMDAIRQVWSSLWSDAALLYRQEIGLDPAKSQMAVLVQPMVTGEISGVAFGRDPRWPQKPEAVLEAVPGLCQELVDGTVDPDRWVLSRPSGKILQRRQGHSRNPNDWVLSNSEVKSIFKLLLRVEDACGWPPDMEWTQSQGKLTLLQARPMSQPPPRSKDLRSWYLSLKPSQNRMRSLRNRITQILIPELEQTGKRFSEENLESLSDPELARAIRQRKKSLAQWKKTYHDDFIPFAHGVRQLATYYNDIVKPENPYEFVGLLNGEATLASLRMKEIKELAETAKGSEVIRRALKTIVSDPTRTPERVWNRFVRALKKKKTGAHFITRFEDFLATKLDLVYGAQSLRTRPDIILNMIHQMVERPDFNRGGRGHTRFLRLREVLQKRFFRLAGSRRKKEAQEILSVARLSWRLRDDDNVLLGRIESQCLRAVSEGARRLIEQKRWPEGTVPVEDQAEHIAKALLDPKIRVVFPIRPKTVAKPAPVQPAAEKPRQLVGQPVAPGLASGIVRRVSGPADMIRFQAGEVLVCDSIQPSITHLVPLACGIVERRGGMLMHGAIVARELGRPCVNGIPRAMELLNDGDRVTIDGFLGIVTVGEPEFDLEKVPSRHSERKNLRTLSGPPQKGPVQRK